ncbi:LysR family transcriptional regulator [Novosphingobium sp. JCM 18896]|uniref:LysR family transcriptional regulator n=1 Tax=Novosphingobium sp. JCM 18896 TaxID=2989731 RepID=UPI0022228B73|nr:LysR family transcriptional regulator [Novosphingobium sp. JCM 18896]MCW1428621.1 LysR family transcriptional regulator [Novosphingobium sp. JCM 18896]
MDLTRLRHIVAVARNRSFSRAAEEEGITQPALSRSIAAFEQRHGVVLFDRGRGGAHPTAAGLAVIERAQALLAAAGDLERSLRRYPGGEVVRVAFGLGPLLTALMLPRLAGSLLDTYPGIQIKTLVGTSDQLVSELLGDRIEMILGNNWNLGRVAGTTIERLGTLRVAVMARGNHPLAQAGRIDASAIEAFPIASAVELPSGGISGQAGGFVCGNFHVLRETVLRSDCVWISSPAFVAEDLRAGRMAMLDVADIAPTDSEICLVLKRGRTRSPAAIAVAGEVRAMLEDMAAAT